VKKRDFLLKLAAITSSVLLVSACVAYRAGVFHSLGASEPADTSTMSGSKVAVGVVGTEDVQAKPAEATSPPAFMPGSKSPGLLVFPPATSTDGPPPSVPAPAGEPPTPATGSKYYPPPGAPYSPPGAQSPSSVPQQQLEPK
jgi:hypothetical protein